MIYLIFNEGYSATEGDQLVRGELSSEAIRLGRLLSELMPDEAEVWGLLALMVLHDARRDARVASDGRYVAIDEQDRSLWDHRRLGGGASRRLRGRRGSGALAIAQGLSALGALARRLTRPGRLRSHQSEASMGALDTLVVTTSLPALREGLHSSLQGLEWTVNAYNLAYACLLLTGAALGDRFGRRRMYTIGLSLFTVASAGPRRWPAAPAP